MELDKTLRLGKSSGTAWIELLTAMIERNDYADARQCKGNMTCGVVV